MFPRRLESRPEPDEATGRVARQDGEILGSHPAVEGPDGVGAEDAACGGGGELRHAPVVDDGWITFVQQDLRATAHGLGNVEAAPQRIGERSADVLLEVPDGAAHDDAVGEDVLGGASGDGADGERALLVWGDASRDPVLAGEDGVGGEDEGIDAFMRPGRVSAASVHGRGEEVGAGHDGAGGDEGVAEREVGADVHAEHGGDVLHGAILDHARRTAESLLIGSLLRRLEDEAHGTLQGPGTVRIGKQTRSAHEHGHVRVVAAGVHHAGRRRAPRDVTRFVNGQRVHVGAQRNDRCAGADLRYDAGPTDAAANAEAGALDGIGSDAGRTLFPEGQLGMAVQITSHGDEVGFEVGGLLQETGHGVGIPVICLANLPGPGDRRQVATGMEHRRSDDARLTEQRNPRSMRIDQLTTLEIVDLINAEDRMVAEAVGEEREAIEEAIDIVVDCFARGGRLLYVGAGTSGRLGVLDASEMPPTYGTDPSMVQGVIAGGYEALVRAQEGAEDHPEDGARDIEARDVGERDFVLGIASSGTTPYVHGALRRAREHGARTGFLLCTYPSADLLETHDVVIAPLVGPEVITGSTRMKAGTATKMVLNTITTAAMVRMGKVYGNLMVDLQVTCEKLRDRGERILLETVGMEREEAAALLERAGGHVKLAIVMGRLDLDAESARRRLDDVGGVIARLIPDLGAI
jgi:N-acetylmuramic acid 6-phosphate etherase